jgi:hypothetical protein
LCGSFSHQAEKCPGAKCTKCGKNGVTVTCGCSHGYEKVKKPPSDKMIKDNEIIENSTRGKEKKDSMPQNRVNKPTLRPENFIMTEK